MLISHARISVTADGNYCPDFPTNWANSLSESRDLDVPRLEGMISQLNGYFLPGALLYTAYQEPHVLCALDRPSGGTF
jgi:hypothetical protein